MVRLSWRDLPVNLIKLSPNDPKNSSTVAPGNYPRIEYCIQCQFLRENLKMNNNGTHSSCAESLVKLQNVIKTYIHSLSRNQKLELDLYKYQFFIVVIIFINDY